MKDIVITLPDNTTLDVKRVHSFRTNNGIVEFYSEDGATLCVVKEWSFFQLTDPDDDDKKEPPKNPDEAIDDWLQKSILNRGE